MANATLEERLAALEQEVAQLKQERRGPASPEAPWWEQISGAFEDDPLFDEAMRLGREWRRSQRNAADAPEAIEL